MADPFGIPAAFWAFLLCQRTRINPKVEYEGRDIFYVLVSATVGGHFAGGKFALAVKEISSIMVPELALRDVDTTRLVFPTHPVLPKGAYHY